MSYIPPVTHIMPLTTIRREWRLPAPGTIAVRVNERINAYDVVAESETTAHHVILDIARALNVPEDLASRHLLCDVGDRLAPGDRIAVGKGWLKRTIRAPANGRVVAISEGRVLFEVLEKPYEMQAIFPCVVVDTDGIRTISVETTGALIQAVWGNGKRDFGVLRMVAGGSSGTLTTETLDIGLRGSVLVAGSCLQAAPLHQATELTVRGLILGSLSAALIPMVKRLEYPVLVLEGFGDVGINNAAYELLKANEGKEASLDGTPSQTYSYRRPEVIIPMPSTRRFDLPEDIVPLSPGVRVRVVRQPHMGEVGVVRELLTRAVSYPNGNMARSARLDLEGAGSVTVPLDNLEVIQ
ncbi:MAG: hypothetical protein PVI78_00520 [Anaerolineales bacterium]